jgi:predicted RNA binding protein YcfA (HicA-like mRNA interferase family)
MPRKLRELRRNLRRTGYTLVKGAGKGSHEKWRHPLVGQAVNLSGQDGSDAKPYQEDAVYEAIERAKEAERKRQP